MATRKMTFTLPEELAVRFLKRVPSRHRSRYLAEALAQKLADRNRQLVRACEIANLDPEVRAIEKEFEAIGDETREVWRGAPDRPKAGRGLVGSSRSNARVGD